MSGIIFREATRNDLGAIVALLADDELGRTRERVETPPADCYEKAFAAVEANPGQQLIVATEDGAVVGTMQLSFLPGIARQGQWRGQIEGVRVAASHRGGGLGRRMILWAIEQCRARGCGLVQLTSDKSRKDAHRFYDRLGFVASHEGYKLTLS
ncbi:MAG TPA: GNAT family N-acetyltransferase [Rhizomicrobium sp.]|nr:GNAT family N-acetyltransferase [Rhizomicrobium sp.]